jgi:hypothetical protein
MLRPAQSRQIQSRTTYLGGQIVPSAPSGLAFDGNGKASCDPTFSGADARALVAAAEKRLPAHDNVIKRLLVNGQGAKNEPTGLWHQASVLQ